MYTNTQKPSLAEVAELRREAGQRLKRLRESRGLSQRDFAAKVGVEYYTFISQLESGHGRIPPDRYLAWAEALEVEPRQFVKELVRFYDPVTYGILFGETGKRVPPRKMRLLDNKAAQIVRRTTAPPDGRRERRFRLSPA